eukprot:1903873-Pyramimonas_sp.AAC.1
MGARGGERRHLDEGRNTFAGPPVPRELAGLCLRIVGSWRSGSSLTFVSCTCPAWGTTDIGHRRFAHPRLPVHMHQSPEELPRAKDCSNTLSRREPRASSRMFWAMSRWTWRRRRRRNEGDGREKQAEEEEQGEQGEEELNGTRSDLISCHPYMGSVVGM